MKNNPLIWALAGLAVVLISGSYYVYNHRSEDSGIVPVSVEVVP